MEPTHTHETGGCLICGAPLKYLKNAEHMHCAVCGKEFENNAVCENGHYICDECHARPAFSVIRYIALNTHSKNPIEIADEMMQSAAVHMHGPEHHVLVGSALAAAYANAGGNVNLPIALTAIEHRGKMIPGGFCGMAGSCGAAGSAGIFLSVILGTTPLSGDEWALGMKLTAKCLSAISDMGGPRCCKRDSFTAIKVTAELIKEHLGIIMEIPEKIHCRFSPLNHECLKDRCRYYHT